MNHVTDAERNRLKALIWPIIHFEETYDNAPMGILAATNQLLDRGVSVGRARSYVAEVIRRKRHNLLCGLDVESNPYEVGK
jgi:hypothetical protein